MSQAHAPLVLFVERYTPDLRSSSKRTANNDLPTRISCVLFALEQFVAVVSHSHEDSSQMLRSIPAYVRVSVENILCSSLTEWV